MSEHVNEITVADGDLVIAAAVRTQADLLGPDAVVIPRATNDGAESVAERFLTGIGDLLEARCFLEAHQRRPERPVLPRSRSGVRRRYGSAG